MSLQGDYTPWGMQSKKKKWVRRAILFPLGLSYALVLATVLPREQHIIRGPSFLFPFLPSSLSPRLLYPACPLNLLPCLVSAFPHHPLLPFFFLPHLLLSSSPSRIFNCCCCSAGSREGGGLFLRLFLLFSL